MLFKSNLKLNFKSFVNPKFSLQINPISSLKVIWRKDQKLGQAIENDKRNKLCARVIKEVLNELGQVIPLRYLDKRRERLRFNVRVKTFINNNPGLFDTYCDRIRRKSDRVPFLWPISRLRNFLEEEKRIYNENEELIVSKLCKLLMMSRFKVISVDKLVHVKREFCLPNDFLVKAEEESSLTGIRVRPNFSYKLSAGFFLRKEMREWVRDCLEFDYISPYADVLHLDQAWREMEKRMVGVFHELLSLSLLKMVPVPILGKFMTIGFRMLFSSVFTRHSGIFYMSLKGGIKTAVLREAYKDDQLFDNDPLLEINDKFVKLLEEGWQERAELLRLHRKQVKKDMEMMAMRN
ncbi:hypothetical protein CRYUN_Cryun20dG0096600 [Craigia yunnanensis]